MIAAARPRLGRGRARWTPRTHAREPTGGPPRATLPCATGAACPITMRTSVVVCAAAPAGLTIRAAICRFLPRYAVVLAAPASRAQPDEAVKGAREGRLVTEAGLAGDI